MQLPSSSMKMNPTFAMSPGGNVLPKLESASQAANGTHDGIKNIPDYKLEAPFEKQRGRAQGRGLVKYKSEIENGEVPGAEALSSADEGGPSRKRRRSRKGLERKFECPEEGCGKVYSRAEHLNRHQLNHNAKKIYPCNQENCPRTFVRQDLCTRHIQRHESKESKGKGSQLGRKDSIMYNPTPWINGRKPKMPRRSLSPESIKTENDPTTQGNYVSPPETSSETFSPTATSATELATTPTSSWFPHSNDEQRHEYSTRLNFPGAEHTGINPFSGQVHERHASFGSVPPTSTVGFMHSPPRPEGVRYGLDMQSLAQQSPLISHVMNYTTSTVSPAGTAGMHHNAPPRTMDNMFNQQNYHPAPPFMLTSGHPPQNPGFGAPYSVPEPARSVPEGFQPHADANEPLWGPEWEMQQQYMPMLFAGGEAGYDRSPNANSTDNLIDLILDGGDREVKLDGSTAPPLGTYSDIPPQFQHQWENELRQNGAPRSTMDVSILLQHKPREHRISDGKAKELFKMIMERFNESEESAIIPLKSMLLDGDRNQKTHMLSTRRMQDYIDLYFDQFHPQIPILHQPTFIPDNTPNLLLIAIMAIGASCLDRKQDRGLSEKAASLSNFLAWHLRSEAINHKEFRPPSSLWMFQTLLLLELYEKMYSDRMLHERAHIHHTTTITLMRRGCSLTGTSGKEYPRKKETKDRPYASPVSNDPWWNHFIETESIHRAAYVAFLIDITHAVMFGHSSSMYVTELKLHLPVDEKVWAAPTCAEAKRLVFLHRGVHNRTSFLDGIWKLWEGKEIRTDTFGRTVLMAGLLFCLWHVKQREQQNENLGEIGQRPKWKWEEWNAQLSSAFDTWSSEFDRSLSSIFQGPYRHREELICESRSVLHHLAHIAMHIDVIECQIYAGAEKLLGRGILDGDRNRVANRWKLKIHLQSTQRAVFYALQFLNSVLLPNSRSGQSQAYDERQQYRARDDPLLNRPWVFYYAALVVWCYGFAKEGKVKLSQEPSDKRQPGWERKEMQDFLKKFYLPDLFKEDSMYLGKMEGWNQNSGLLRMVRSCFDDCRWELLKEAQLLLDKCVLSNAGRNLSAASS